MDRKATVAGEDYPDVWREGREDCSGRMPEPAGGTPTLPGNEPSRRYNSRARAREAPAEGYEDAGEEDGTNVSQQNRTKAGPAKGNAEAIEGTG